MFVTLVVVVIADRIRYRPEWRVVHKDERSNGSFSEVLTESASFIFHLRGGVRRINGAASFISAEASDGIPWRLLLFLCSC